MKIRKTRSEQRSDYSYPINVQVGSDKWETKFITIRPGVDGVTEADIKTLHSLDDSEVYYNNKNMHPAKTDEEKAKMKEFELNFIAKFQEEHGYEPNSSYVKDVLKEAFPTNWNLSIDWEMEKLMGKSTFNEVLGDLVIKPPDKPTLVSITDKRQAINVNNTNNEFNETKEEFNHGKSN